MATRMQYLKFHALVHSRDGSRAAYAVDQQRRAAQREKFQ